MSIVNVELSRAAAKMKLLPLELDHHLLLSTQHVISCSDCSASRCVSEREEGGAGGEQPCGFVDVTLHQVCSDHRRILR